MREYNRWGVSQISRKIRYPKFSRESKITGQTVFQTCFDGILLVNKQYEILQANPSFHRLYGTPDSPALAGLHLTEIIPSAHFGLVTSMLEYCCQAGTSSQSIEVEIFNHEKHRIPVYIWCSQPFDSFLQLYIRDISDWKAMQDNLTRTNLELGDAYWETLEGWVRALDLRDHETEDHSMRVTDMTVRLASAVGLSVETIYHMRFGAMLHDIGKMAIPDSILLKAGPLTASEWDVMKMHPIHAYNMLSKINFLKTASIIPYYHHERWDGSGYPHGLCGEEIPIEARVFAVADVWDALRSNRPYREGWPEEKVRQYIADNKGIHFDPAIVDVFLNL
jgi:putative nucleotidyltransferase with HDIG domain